MKDKRPPTTSCKSVYSYLKEVIAFWELSGRPDLVRDYSDALELVGIAMFGNPPAPVTNRVQVLNVPCPQTATMPVWKRQLLSRPLRRIVKVEVYRERDASTGSVAYTWLEHLECKHVNTHYPFTATERRARHRRCKECQNQQRSIHAELDQRKMARAAS